MKGHIIALVLIPLLIILFLTTSNLLYLARKKQELNTASDSLKTIQILTELSNELSKEQFIRAGDLPVEQRSGQFKSTNKAKLNAINRFMDILNQIKLYPLQKIAEGLTEQERTVQNEMSVFIVTFLIVLATSALFGLGLYKKIDRRISSDFNELTDAKLEIEEKNENLRRNLETQKDQNDLMNLMMSSKNSEELAGNVLTKIGTLLENEISIFYVVNEDRLEVRATRGINKESIKNHKVGESLSGKSAQEKKVLHYHFTEAPPHIDILGTQPNLTHAMAIPLLYNQQALGVLEFAFRGHPNEVHENFIRGLAPLIATQLLTLDRHEKVKKQSQELKILNIELEASKKILELKARELAKANKTKSMFLANVSHELRTPLNSIIILSKMLMRARGREMGDKEIKNASVIHSAGEDLLGLINDILDLSKIEAGHVTLTNEEINVAELTESLNDLFIYLARDKGIEWILEVAPDAPEVIVADKGKVEQILKNMLSNALKFTHKGHVKLEISADSAQNIHFQVSDTGVGIAPSKHAKIFEAFEQSNQSISRDYGGTGLGLTISKNLALMMGGDLKLEKSTLGDGSTFSLTLPSTKSKIAMTVGLTEEIKGELAKALNAHGWGLTELALQNLEYMNDAIVITGPEYTHSIAVHESHLQKVFVVVDEEEKLHLIDNLRSDYPLIEIIKWDSMATNGLISKLEGEYDSRIHLKPGHTPLAAEGDKELGTLNGKRVLIVDDDRRNTYALTQVLEASGIEAHTAYNGEECINFLRNNEVELIFMDIMMPVMDGLKTISYIRNDMKKVDLPIIALTAKAMPEDRLQCLEVGASDYISKPLDISLVQSALLKWLIHTEAQITPHDSEAI